jgi:two-component sensor histidine kinase
MPLTRPLSRLHRWSSRRLALWMRYGLGAVFVLLGLAARYALTFAGWPNAGYPFLLYWYSIVATASLGAGGAGYFATALSVLLCLPFVPADAAGWVRMDWVLPIAVFVGSGIWITALVESLFRALADLEAALAEGREAARRRGLLLTEYRHRSRGDLQSISSLLRLRARYAVDPAAKRALAEAAAHTTALGKIHSRLENAQHDMNEVAVVDSGSFVQGVCADLMPPISGVFAASRPISTERSVALGLLLVELVAAARLDGAAVVVVQLAVLGLNFTLDVVDDRPGLGETDGLRTRLTTLLAGQLRGTLTRVANVPGPGWAAVVLFPVLAPVLAPGRVGV